MIMISQDHNSLIGAATNRASFDPVGSVLGGVLKEIARRAELRQRLEAECGRPISDREFLRVAEETGGMRL